ncbi:calcium/proton exchanger [Rhizoctonia solani 123E]|uniref:Calcium/proton exchanger n=1 Tax=Rhizoctonia solani 123E TaxID=1423351 RepID=A0A074RNB4_9AGAM|nr:calcium/proton exchanger [Rhizoctonia solani 123E]
MSDSQPQPSSRSATTTAISPSTTRNGVTRNPSRANTNRDLESGLDKINKTTKPAARNGEHHHHLHIGDLNTIPRTKAFWAKFNGAGKKHVPGWVESANNTVRHSWLNVFVVFIPLSWAAHWAHWHYSLIFSFSFLAIIPLEKLSDFGGEQMALYLGTSLGDLLVITLDNVVEATLAIILLTHCELKLVQSTLIGVILLHLLLVPGTAFLTGGAQIWEQHLRPHPTQLNHSLLTFGVMILLLPVALFTALPASLPGNGSGGSTTATAARLIARAGGGEAEGLAIKEAMIHAAEAMAVTDSTRGTFLKFSRGLSILLLIAYLGSRIYLHNPPGENNALDLHPNAPEVEKRKEAEIEQEQPDIGPWFGIVLLAVTVALIAVTAEWLVSSIEQVRDRGTISSEWFGLILLPLLSYSADGLIAAIYFAKTILLLNPGSPEELAKARSIDLSIQFALFWTPFVVLLGWWTHRPMSLLFDLWEVAILIGACFLVNYVTADAKTNWVEGMVMVLFYVAIALVAWFYDGQPEVHEMLRCESVADSIAVVANAIAEVASEAAH